MQDDEGPLTLEEVERSLSDMEATLRKARLRNVFLENPTPPAYYDSDYWISYIQENVPIATGDRHESPIKTPDGFEVNLYHVQDELWIRILRAGSSEVFLKFHIPRRQAPNINCRIKPSASPMRPNLKTTGTHRTGTKLRPPEPDKPTVCYRPYRSEKYEIERKDRLEDTEAFHAYLDRKHNRAEPLIQLPSGEWVHLEHVTDLD